jgi:hypothetical protein
VLDKVEHRRLRPVDVLDDDDERSDGRHGLEQLAHPPKRLFDRELLRGEADCGSGAPRDGVVLRESTDLRARHVGRILFEDARRLPDDLQDGPEGDAAPVREAAAPDHCGRPVDLRHELLGQTRLAHSRTAENRREPATADRDRFGKRPEEESELPLPSDEWPVLPRHL